MPIVLVRCTVGDILFILYVCLFVCSFQGFLAMVCLMPYKIDTTEIQLMELNSFKEVANNIGEGCGNVPIVLVRCTVGDMLYKSSINKSTIIPIIPVYGLRTPNEGINQRNLKIWTDLADKICFGRT